MSESDGRMVLHCCWFIWSSLEKLLGLPCRFSIVTSALADASHSGRASKQTNKSVSYSYFLLHDSQNTRACPTRHWHAHQVMPRDNERKLPCCNGTRYLVFSWLVCLYIYNCASGVCDAILRIAARMDGCCWCHPRHIKCHETYALCYNKHLLLNLQSIRCFIVR